MVQLSGDRPAVIHINLYCKIAIMNTRQMHLYCTGQIKNCQYNRNEVLIYAMRHPLGCFSLDIALLSWHNLGEYKMP